MQPEAVTWLFHPYIPRGKVTSIEGDPGVGKSQFTLAISAKVSRGQHNQGVPERVLILTAEDGLADTIRPRLDTLEADLDCIKALDGYFLLDDPGLNNCA